MEVKHYYQKNKIFELDINKITADKFINTYIFSEEEVLCAAAKIKKFGLCLPLCVRKNIVKEGEFFVFSDILSFLALKYLNVKKVPAIIYSYTLPEAVIFHLINQKETNIFKKAELFKFLLKKGNYTVKEICDIFKISPSRLDLILLPLVLNEKEKEVFTLKGFDYLFLKEFLKIKEEERSDILNEIVAKELSQKDALLLIKEGFEKKEKPLKAAFLKNDTVIMNSMQRLSKSLETFGISSIVEKIEENEKFEYRLILNNNPNQLCFDFESIS